MEYTYDLFERRIARQVDADGAAGFETTQRFVYDGEDLILAFSGPTNALTNRHLYGPATDEILADEQLSTTTGIAGTVTWSLGDHLGTIRDLVQYNATTGTTTVVNHVRYDTFGQIVSQTNSQFQPWFAYTGREWDPAAGLYFYRARWYDPRAGRFTSEDPLGFAAGDVNLSRYVGNGATLWVDPSGMDAQRVGHHYIPQSVLKSLMKAALLDKDSAVLLDAFTEIPRHMKHGYDSWLVDGQKITHAAYNKAMEELMRGIAKQSPTGKIDKEMAEQLIRAFETGDFSKYSFATDQLVIIRNWCRGFLEAQGLSHALSQLIDKLKLEQLSEKEMKAAVRYLMGDRTVDLNAKAKTIIKALEDGGTAQLFSRMAANSAPFKRAGKFLGFVSWAFFARDVMAGAVGEGHRPDLKGLPGAIDNAAYEAMMAGEIEECFRSMANSAAAASGGLQGIGPIDRKRIGMDLPPLGSERVPQKSHR